MLNEYSWLKHCCLLVTHYYYYWILLQWIFLTYIHLFNQPLINMMLKFSMQNINIYMLLWRRLIKKKMLCLFYTRKACGRRRLRAYIYCWSLVPPLHQLSVCVSGKCPFYTPGRRVDRVRSGTPGDSRYAIVSAIQLPSCQINIPLKLIMASSTALVYTAILFL